MPQRSVFAPGGVVDSVDAREPLVERLTPAIDPVVAFRKLCHLPHCLFLDSVLRDSRLGRYSFLAVDPFDFFEVPADTTDALSLLETRIRPFAAHPVEGLPPFQGGAAGLLGYELGRGIESVSSATDEFGVPAMSVGLYDTVIAWDHVEEDAWIISHGFPEPNPLLRQKRASQRIVQLRRSLAGDGQNERFSCHTVPATQVLTPEQIVPQHSVGPIENLTSNLSPNQYRQMIERGIEYIYAGDIFQVNLAQRLLHPATDSSARLYERLRERNPATFAGYFDLGEFQVISASPERLVRLHEGQLEARPIKGTRLRTAMAEADLFAADELSQSEKDLAENIMIVDLLRNDLSRVATPNSVRVTQLCQLEKYATVQHLVSAITGQIGAEYGPVDLLRALFPGGSITGAPKVRAMQIIAELEPTARGVYCGSLGYLGFDGSLDLSILIRTITAGRGWWQFPVGGGIVAQSDPEREYEETWHKAAGMLRALI